MYIGAKTRRVVIKPRKVSVKEPLLLEAPKMTMVDWRSLPKRERVPMKRDRN